MAIIPKEIQERLDQQEDQIKVNNLKNKRISHELNNYKKKTRANKIWKFMFFIIAIGLGGYTYFLKIQNPSSVNSEELELCSKENESLLSRIDSLKTSNIASTSSSNNESNENNILSYNGVLYRVQLGAFKKFRVRTYSKSISSLLDTKTKGLLKKYSLGIFTNVNQAKKFRRELIKLGFRDCFVVPEYKGKTVSYRKARSITKKLNKRK